MLISEFPTWRYHRTKGGKVFHSQAEFDADGEGWEDSPAKFKTPGVVTTEQAHGRPAQTSEDEKKDQQPAQPTAKEIRVMNKQELYDLAKSLNPAVVPAFEDCTKNSLKEIILAAAQDNQPTA